MSSITDILSAELQATILNSVEDNQLSLVSKQFYAVNNFVMEQSWNRGKKFFEEQPEIWVCRSLLQRMVAIEGGNESMSLRFKKLFHSQLESVRETESASAVNQFTEMQERYKTSFSLIRFIQEEEAIEKGYKDRDLLTFWEEIFKQLNLQRVVVENPPTRVDEIDPWLLQNQNLVANIGELDLSNKKLKFLPEQISLLRGLRVLNLSGNELMDLPEKMSALTKLRNLCINNNQFSCVPRVVCSLLKLENLNLAYNRLSDLPEEMSALTELTILGLDRNLFSHIPQVVCSLTQLQYLYLRNNQLSDLPQEISALTQLNALFISNNQFSRVPQVVCSFTQLRSLSFDNNQLSDLPEEMRALTELRNLYINDNQFSRVPQVVCSFTQLRSLSLDNNQLSDLPEEMRALTELRNLYINDNQFSRFPREVIADLQRITFLQINNNQITEMPHLAGMPNLVISALGNPIQQVQVPGFHEWFEQHFTLPYGNLGIYNTTASMINYFMMNVVAPVLHSFM
jgi:Leucine-rich repeat (LRR) protein